MSFKRFTTMTIKNGRETVFLLDTGNARGSFKETVRKYANGLLNSHGGVIYFGVDTNGTILGNKINRKEEDDFRLSVDHTIGNFQPFISSSLYRLSFLNLYERNDTSSDYKIIELKISVGNLGEIYEDGMKKVFIIDTGDLIGPLYPQELKELILLKYKESIEGAEEALKYTTPNLAAAKIKAKTISKPPRVTSTSTLTDIVEVEENENIRPSEVVSKRPLEIVIRKPLAVVHINRKPLERRPLERRPLDIIDRRPLETFNRRPLEMDRRPISSVRPSIRYTNDFF